MSTRVSKATINEKQAMGIRATTNGRPGMDVGSEHGTRGVQDTWGHATWAQANGRVVKRAPPALGRKSPRRGRPRAILTDAKAREIYAAMGRRSSQDVGSEYGISPKAVRDVWKGHTWARATKCRGMRAYLNRRTKGREGVCTRTSRKGAVVSGDGGCTRTEGMAVGTVPTQASASTQTPSCWDVECKAFVWDTSCNEDFSCWSQLDTEIAGLYGEVAH